MVDGRELQRLLEAGRHWECLGRGRTLLEEPSLSEGERVRVLLVLCRCHLALGQAQAAVLASRKAAALAGRLHDQEAAGESLLAVLDACLMVQDLAGAEAWLAEAERHAATRLVDGGFAAALLLARARLLGLGGRHQASVDEAFRALMAARPLSPLQVQAQLHLGRMGELMDRPVEAFSFALAARVSAMDGLHGALESEATALMVRLLRRYGIGPVVELAWELERQGVDLYQYMDLETMERLARGE
ncbi:MAG: hypothetical protein ACOY93_16560 [Bacillota bacterium]